MARIAWFSANNPFPPRGGADVRAGGLIGLTLAGGHEVLLVHTNPLRPDQTGDFPSIHVPDARRFERRARKLIRFAPLSAALPDPKALSRARRQLQHFDPDVVIMSELFTWPLVSRLRGTTPLIYDAHNFERDLHRQIQSLTTSIPSRVLAQIDRPRIARVEREVVATSTAVWAVSEDDARGLIETCPYARVWVAPNSCPTPTRPADPGSAEETILFVGNMEYEPNIRAIEALVLSILPVVRRKCPTARLMLVGNHASSRVARLVDGIADIDLHVGVPDLEPFYARARVVVVPMTHGSGSNIKVLEALSYGVPVIASPVAVRGIPVDDGEGVLVRDSAVSIAEAGARLLQAPDLAAGLGSIGREVFVNRLSWSVAAGGAVAAGLQQALKR